MRVRHPLVLPVTLCLATALAAGCGERLEDRRGPVERPDPQAVTMETTNDNGAAVRAELLDADRRFAATVASAAGADRTAVWAGWFAPAGRQLVPAAVVTGAEAIAALMGPTFADPGFSLAWEPDLAEGAGDWGWTSGRYVSTRPGPDGPVRGEGRYLTVWQRQPGGAWKVAVDTGVPDSR